MVAMLERITQKARTVEYFIKESGVAPESTVQYYAGRDFNHRAASRWFGEGARMLKLRGQVKADDFRDILDGKVRGTDIKLGRRITDETTGKVRLDHNPGDDMTFAAPKSVSIAALHHKEKDAHDAFDEAVKEAVAYAESHHIETRRNQQRENTGRMVAAIFKHDSSRNHDPHLHHHCIVANMTCRSDGKWMSIDRGSLSLNRRLIEAVFHNALARGLMERGYKLRPVQHGGKRIFEIEGYTDEVIQTFSSRRMEILASVDARGEERTREATNRAWRRTRQTKQDITREELHSKWAEIAAEIGHENPSSKQERRKTRKELRQARAQGIEDPMGRDIEADLFKAIDASLEHLGYHTPVIREPDLKAAVMERLAGRITMERIDGALARMEEDGHLVRTMKSGKRTAWVTRESLLAERGVVDFMRGGRGEAKAIRPGFDAGAEIAGRGLTQGQMDAIASVLTATDQVSGVQGYAGTGKTTMLRSMVKAAGERKFIGLAPTVGASILLEGESGIPTQTLQKFLARHRGIGGMDDNRLEALRREHEGAVLVVDEASMIGTRQMKDLFAITDRLGIGRVVLVGDTRQLRSIEAGQPFRQLQEHGMETAEMKDIVRQKHEGLKVPVEMMLAGNATCALERLADEGNERGRLVEAPREDLHTSVAGIYLELDEEQRRDTIVMAQTNHDRQEINERIREGLAEEGFLGYREYEGIRLVNRHLTPAQKGDALNYEPGDVVVFHSKYRMESGEDHFTVTAIGEDGKLHMKGVSGHLKTFDPGKGGMASRFEVFEEADIALRENDLVRITRNDPDLRDRGVVNGAGATVERIGEDSITLRLAGDDGDPKGDGERVELGLDDNTLKHIDHGYCRTTYAAQGRTAGRVVAMVDSGLGELADQQNFYVQISRASEECVVVTDDIDDLTENLEQRTGERLTAMEAVGDPGWGFDLGKDGTKGARLQGWGEWDDRFPDREIRMPELSMPDHFPPEVASMLDRMGEKAKAGPGAVIGNGVFEVPSEALNKLAAEAWLELPDDVRERTGIYASPERQGEIEHVIRKRLHEEGKVAGASIRVNRRIVAPLSAGEKMEASSFERGDHLMFTEDVPELGIRAGNSALVLDPFGGDGQNTIRVRVRDESGKHLERDLDPRKTTPSTVFRPLELQLMAGDRVRWRRRSDEHGIESGDGAVVTNVDYMGRIVQFKNDKGETREIQASDPVFMGCDHAFNLSAWEFSRKEDQSVIAVVDTERPNLGVAVDVQGKLDRRAGTAVLLTDNATHLNGQLERHGENLLTLGEGAEGLVVGPGGSIGRELEAWEKERERQLGIEQAKKQEEQNSKEQDKERGQEPDGGRGMRM